MKFAGVDGCSNGWVVASWEDTDPPGAVTIHLAKTFEEVVSGNYKIIAVDIPIGLPDEGRRICDTEARQLLASRSSCVFSAPIRPVLRAPDRLRASEMGRAIDGRAVTVQTWGIVPKIREVDQIMESGQQARVIEVHPELCFWAMNNQAAVMVSKKRQAGKAYRRAILQQHLFDPDWACTQKPHGAKVDDVYDALAALWTARRKASQQATRVPQHDQHDAKGLRMEMWY